VAKLHIDQDKFRLDVEPTSARDRGLSPVEISGSGDYHLHIDFPDSVPDKPYVVVPRLWTDFSGRAGNVEIQGHFGGNGIQTMLDEPGGKQSEAVGKISVTPVPGIRKVICLSTSCFPTFYELGLIEGFAKKFQPKATVTLDKTRIQKKQGGDSNTFIVTW